MRRRKNSSLPWEDIQKARNVPERIAGVMDDLADALTGARRLLDVYKKEDYPFHVIKTLRSDIETTERALQKLDSAYSGINIARWTFR